MALDRRQTIRAGRFPALSMKYWSLKGCYIILIGMLVAGCKKENVNYTARITVLNAVPDAASMDVYAAGEQLNAPLLFGNPDYNIEVPAVTDSIKWKISSRSSFDSVMIADLPNGQDFTLLFFDSASRFRSYLIKDSWQQPASETKAYVRFFPMVVNASNLQVTNDTGKVIITGSYGGFATGASPFVAKDTFSTKLRLYSNSILLDSLPGTELLPGKSYSIYAVGVLNATGDKRPRMILHQHQ